MSNAEPARVLRHELPEEDRKCECCGEVCTEFAVESSKQIEIIPARVEVIQHDRVKYACRACQGSVVVASKPPQPIEKGLPGPGLWAHVTLSKFGDHTPLCRLEDIFLRIGFEIRRSTLCGWLITLAALTRPLVMRMKHLVLDSKVIHTDDTSIKMLQPGAGIAQEAKFWPYLGDWFHPYAVYDFTIDRKRNGPLKFLEGFKGYLQADAYAGYDCKAPAFRPFRRTSGIASRTGKAANCRSCFTSKNNQCFPAFVEASRRSLAGLWRPMGGTDEGGTAFVGGARGTACGPATHDKPRSTKFGPSRVAKRALAIWVKVEKAAVRLEILPNELADAFLNVHKTARPERLGVRSALPSVWAIVRRRHAWLDGILRPHRTNLELRNSGLFGVYENAIFE